MVWETIFEKVTIKLKLQDGKKPAMLRAGGESFLDKGYSKDSIEVEYSLGGFREQEEARGADVYGQGGEG